MPRINGLAAGVPVSSYGANANLNTYGGTRKQGIASTKNIRSKLFFPIRSRTHQSDPGYLLCNRTNPLSGGVGRRSGSFVPGAGGIDEETYICWYGRTRNTIRQLFDYQKRQWAKYPPSEAAKLNEIVNRFNAFRLAFQQSEGSSVTYDLALVGSRETLIGDGVNQHVNQSVLDQIQHLGEGSTSPAWQYLTTTYADPATRSQLLDDVNFIKNINYKTFVKPWKDIYGHEAYELNKNKNNHSYIQSLLRLHEFGLVPTEAVPLLRRDDAAFGQKYGQPLHKFVPGLQHIYAYGPCCVDCPCLPDCDGPCGYDSCAEACRAGYTMCC